MSREKPCTVASQARIALLQSIARADLIGLLPLAVVAFSAWRAAG
jgi:hypothetical protein